MTQSTHNTQANPMWGGHFSEGPAAIMERINVSIDFDQVLYEQDIRGSKAHCEMLALVGVISQEEAAQIIEGLDAIHGEIEAGTFTFQTSLEDIHMNIEARLKELIGDVAGKLHTGRSRNDQVATDFKLWVRDAIDVLDSELQSFQQALITQAEQHTDTIMPGFTHLQIAQPVTFGHHLMAYVEMAARDRGRLQDARKRLNECPLGAAALAGTSFPLDRKNTAHALGFDRPTTNSLDSVSDRDFALEFLSVLSISATHFSRLAEEIVLWVSDGFRFINLSHAFTTGSSIMPQKRNPDAAELVRAKTGRVFGHLLSLLTAMKGLPLAYSKDMQEDKEPVFDAADTLLLAVKAMTGMVQDMKANPERMREAALKGYSTATDLADWLVRHLGIPFRECHHITGKVVCLAEGQGCRLDELSLEALQSVEPRITEDIFTVLSVENSVKSRTSFGGTAPDNVKHAIQEAKKRYL